MKLVRSIAFAALAFYLAPAIAETYSIDDKGTHAFIQFKANHLGYSYVIGRFNTFDGTFSYDESNPGATTFNVNIDAASLDSNHAERDKHLRSSDFFDVNKHPSITFASTAFEENADGGFTLTGDLSMMGMTKSVEIDGKHIGHGDDPWGGYRRGMEGTVMLDATEFGFAPWVGDVEIYMVGEGIRQ